MTKTLVEGDCYAGHKNQDVHYVTIGTPAPDHASSVGDFYCPIRIEMPKGSGHVVNAEAFGVNALQALEMAFVLIRQKLKIVHSSAPERSNI